MSRFGISTGSRVQQGKVRKLARAMADDPGMLVPECAGDCSRCHFDRVLARLQRIKAHRDNPKALKRLASSGPALERGYAAMLLLLAEDGPIMFATVKLASGDVSYATRGKASKEVMAGLQHFDDPKLRLLAYGEMARKGLHIYSMQDRLLCTGRAPSYPGEMLDELIRSTGYGLRHDGRGYNCEHSAGGAMALRITVKSLGRTVSLCRACASRKLNLYTEITGRMLARHPERDFSLELEHDIECHLGDKCTIPPAHPGAEALLKRYTVGEISDRELLDLHADGVREWLGTLPGPVLVLGNRCFEDDVDAFISALGPSELEEKALRRVLARLEGPVVVDSATPSAVLSLFWARKGANAIHAVTGDRELAVRIFNESRGSGKSPSQILRDAALASRSMKALEALPDLNSLGPVGRYADELARTYKAAGREDMLRAMRQTSDTRLKSINCGFLLALGALKGKEWQFTKEELDYGRYLGDFARALLESEPNEYADALQNLLTASGSGESVG